MKTRSYVEGYAFSAKDVEVFGKIACRTKAALRRCSWYVPRRPRPAPSASRWWRAAPIEADARRPPLPKKPRRPARKARRRTTTTTWGDDEEQTEEEKAQAAKELEEAKAKAGEIGQEGGEPRLLCNLIVLGGGPDQGSLCCNKRPS